MTRTRSIVVRSLPTAVVFFSLHGVASAAEPQADVAKNDPGLGNILPVVIGGAITLGILGAGLILMGPKPKPRGTPTEKDPTYPDDLPRDLVSSSIPLRYFVAPIGLAVLLAVLLPLGYSVWGSMPEWDKNFPKPQNVNLKLPPPPDWSNTTTIDLRPPEFTMPQAPSGPTKFHVQYIQPPPPARMPTIPGPPHR